MRQAPVRGTVCRGLNKCCLCASEQSHLSEIGAQRTSSMDFPVVNYRASFSPALQLCGAGRSYSWRGGWRRLAQGSQCCGDLSGTTGGLMPGRKREGLSAPAEAVGSELCHSSGLFEGFEA